MRLPRPRFFEPLNDDITLPQFRLAPGARDLRPRPAYLAGYGQRLAFEVAGRIGSLKRLH